MVSVSVRPLLVSGIALAAAGVVAVGPVVAPSAPAALPSVHVEDIRLAGVGLDIYNAITPTVQYVVGGGSYLVNFIPVIGGPIAAQININYFQGIQPAVQATVNYLAGVVADPINIIPTTQAYGVALYDIGYNYVSAQLTFLGLPPLAPLAPIVASTPSRTSAPSAVKAAAVRASRSVRSAAAVEEPCSVVTSVASAPAPAPVKAARSASVHKAARTARK